MRNIGALSVVFVVAMGGESAAETWKADPVLNKEKSVGGCPSFPVPYTLEVADNIFSASTEVAKYFSIPVPADGKIQKAFRSPSGQRLEMVGNVKTKDLEVINSIFGCRWKLVPK